MCHERNHTSVHEQVHGVYTSVFVLQFACTPKCTQSKCFDMCIPDMHVCICRLSCTHLVCTWELWMAGVWCHQSGVHTHACMHLNWNTCYVEHIPHVCCVKFKLSCTVFLPAGLLCLFSVLAYGWYSYLIFYAYLLYKPSLPAFSAMLTCYCYGYLVA